MSDTLAKAVAALNEKLGGDAFEGTAKFAIEGMGAIMLDESGARIGDDAAEITLSADADTFSAILAGEINPTTAFMSGKLTVDGDMGMAMQLASALA